MAGETSDPVDVGGVQLPEAVGRPHGPAVRGAAPERGEFPGAAVARPVDGTDADRTRPGATAAERRQDTRVRTAVEGHPPEPQVAKSNVHR